MSGSVLLSLSNPAAFSSIFRIDIKAALKSTGLTNDTVSIYGQVFASDLITPLTGEVLLATRTANSTATVTVTAPHEGYGTIITADWTGARLRLRWEYAINANEEAIRLDPSIPSLAVGNPLPTGTQTGGDGFWTGAIDGGYALRIGGALNSAPQLLYDGAVGRLAFRNTTGTEMIVLDADGSAYFSGPMTIGAAGGIWQGTGSFTTPTTGLKIYNSSGVGRLSTYNAGLEQVTINTTGQLVAGAGKVSLDRTGIAISPLLGGTTPALRFTSSTSDSTYGYLDGSTSGVTLGLKGTTVLNGPRMEVTRDGLWLRHVGLSTATLSVTNSAIVADFENGGVFSVNDRLGVVNDITTGGGLAIGDAALPPPAAGRILMKQSTGATMPPAGTALLYLENQANNKQALWVRFDDGTFVKLGESAS
jgi:hypothetical protein